MIKPRNRGFTLVELLVVIAIIAVLVSTTAVMAPKIRKKGLQAKSVANMRQMMTLVNTYAMDHSNRMPAPAVKAEDSEAEKETYWFAYLQQEINGDELVRYTTDKWWLTNNSPFINPLFPKKSIKANAVGYAMNGLLATNLAESRDEKLDPDDAKYTPVSLAAIREPERTPIVMPHWSWSYKCDLREANDKKFEPFLVNNRLPVLFVDGHVETLSPKEYAKRKLDKAPQSKD